MTWEPDFTVTPEVQAEADRLIALGYRKVSNAKRIVARVDRPDWLESMAVYYRKPAIDFYFIPWQDQQVKRPLMAAYPDGHTADSYRRGFSTDTIWDVAPAVFRLIPSSNHDHVGYIDPETKREVPCVPRELTFIEEVERLMAADVDEAGLRAGLAKALEVYDKPAYLSRNNRNHTPGHPTLPAGSAAEEHF